MHAAFERLKRRAALPCVRAVVALRGARWGLAEREPEPAHAPAHARAAPPQDRRRGMHGESHLLAASYTRTQPRRTRTTKSTVEIH